MLLAPLYGSLNVNNHFTQGMVDPGEAVSVTLKREFGEEALNMLEVSKEDKKKLEASVNEMFSRGIEV